jgi:hypothetical protein
MIAAALEAEVDEYVSSLIDEVDRQAAGCPQRPCAGAPGDSRVGDGPGPGAEGERQRVDDESGKRKRFSSRILPAYARRSPKVTEVSPILYLHGLSTGDFGPALRDPCSPAQAP